MLLGLTQGFGVALGQRFGAKDEAGLTRFFPPPSSCCQSCWASQACS